MARRRRSDEDATLGCLVYMLLIIFLMPIAGIYFLCKPSPNAKGSTGLGLSIAKQLTEKMGGSIRAEWKKGNLSILLRWEEK